MQIALAIQVIHRNARDGMHYDRATLVTVAGPDHEATFLLDWDRYEGDFKASRIRRALRESGLSDVVVMEVPPGDLQPREYDRAIRWYKDRERVLPRGWNPASLSALEWLDLLQ